MIKKIAQFSLISVFSWTASAGDMGSFGPCTSAFLSLEASYTRNSIANYEFTVLGTTDSLFSLKKNELGGGRIAGGMLWRAYDELGLTAEIGWGYYGRTKLSPVGTGIFATIPATFTATNTLTAFDILIGAAYLTPCYSFFLKAGPLVETNFASFHGEFTPAPLTSFIFTFKDNKTGVLPAVKVGGSYIFNDYWSLTVAYMYAFGHRVVTRGTFDAVTASSSIDVRIQDPSLSSVMVGLQFII